MEAAVGAVDVAGRVQGADGQARGRDPGHGRRRIAVRSRGWLAPGTPESEIQPAPGDLTPLKPSFDR